MAQIDDLKAMLSATDMNAFSLEEQRASYDSLGQIMPLADKVKSETLLINSIPCEQFTNDDSASDSILMYLHGGGYVIGSLQSHRPLFGELCNATGIKVLGVDYRLAPENPHPAAIDDAVSIYQWVLQQGYKAENVAIGGDSAGGGLTMAVLIALKQKSLPLPACAVCISPWVDLSMSGASISANADIDPVVSLEGLSKMADQYCQGQEPSAPLISPLFADLSGLPPILIHVGTDECLLDDSRSLFDKLKAAGVDVEYKEWQGMIHVFQHFSAMLDVGKEANLEIGKYIKSKLAQVF